MSENQAGNNLTFAIPFYKGREFLRRSITSILQQTITDWRLIVCDDCSPEDGIKELVESYADSRIGYQRNESNLGLAGNWNVCLASAKTDYVTIVHADDELDPTYGETMLRGFRDWPDAAAIYCNAVVIDNHGTETFSFPDLVKKFVSPAGKDATILKGDEGLRALLKGNFIFCPSLCYCTSRIGPKTFDNKWKFVVDMDFTCSLIAEGHSIVGLPQVAYRYRRHSGSETSRLTESADRFREERDFYNYFSKRADALGWTSSARTAKNKTMIKLNLAYCITQDLSRLKIREAGRKSRFMARMLRD